jgi:MFS family permease
MVFEFQQFWIEVVFSFLLIFVLIFAILQKAKFLGEERKINSLIALAVAFLFVIFPPARNLVVVLMPFLAVGVAVILVFLLMYGMVAGDLKDIPKGIRITFGILAAIFLAVVIFWASGLWTKLGELFGSEGTLASTIVFIIITIGAVIFIIVNSNKS